MPEGLEENIKDDEYLYRGIVEVNWDFKRKRLSSAAFKDSKGVSVDRQGEREDDECINFLNRKKAFFAICKIKTKIVRDLGAIVKYAPIDNNIFHSEIHDSTEKVQMRGSKPKRLRENSKIIYKK